MGAGWQEIAVGALAAGAAAWLLVLRHRRGHRNCDTCALAAAVKDEPRGTATGPPRNTPGAG